MKIVSLLKYKNLLTACPGASCRAAEISYKSTETQKSVDHPPTDFNGYSASKLRH